LADGCEELVRTGVADETELALEVASIFAPLRTMLGRRAAARCRPVRSRRPHVGPARPALGTPATLSLGRRAALRTVGRTASRRTRRTPRRSGRRAAGTTHRSEAIDRTLERGCHARACGLARSPCSSMESVAQTSSATPSLLTSPTKAPYRGRRKRAHQRRHPPRQASHPADDPVVRDFPPAVLA
jgi:hypothetical protein